jgi:hypothetical protein
MRSKAGHSALVAAGTAIVATGLIGLAHAPFARSFLMSLGGCPVAGARMTPAVAEHARQMALGAERPRSGEQADEVSVSAPVRPALGFALDATTQQEVREWARREHAGCEDTRPGLLTCTGVRPEALGLPPDQGRIDELALEFDPRDRLVNMTTFRTHLTPASASTRARAIVASLVEKLGPAAGRAGDFEASTLAARPAGSISTVRYRFADYVADVTAMNAPSSGPSIREHYMSARD